MGRPPCCDKEGVKKGPWTPEEDILLVSYIQEHGPGNWRAVPTNTGLLRCSKSCRLRWTNYLRPGIKRGNFTDQEEKMIIHLQALLGNRWAAIASYLPQRTDNDIKNYWNTHLRKKLRKLQSNPQQSLFSMASSPEKHNNNSSSSSSRGQWERRLQTDIQMAKQALCDALSSADQKSPSNLPQSIINSPSSNSTSTLPNHHHKQGQQSIYASSTENIARLLQGWSRKNCPKKENSSSMTTTTDQNSHSSTMETAQSEEKMSKIRVDNNIHHELAYDEAFRSLFGTIESNSGSPNSDFSETSLFEHESKPMCGNDSKLSLLEKWLFDDCNSMQHSSCGPQSQQDQEELTDLPLQEDADFL